MQTANAAMNPQQMQQMSMQFQREADAYFDIVSDFDGIADHFASRG